MHDKTLADFVRNARKRIRKISVEEFDEMIENHDDLLIVDVRESGKFQRGHIPRALLLPREILESARNGTDRQRLDKLFGAHRIYLSPSCVAWNMQNSCLHASSSENYP